MCWNVIGLNSEARQRAVRRKLMKVSVLLPVCRKPNALLLILDHLKASALRDLTALLALPPWELLGEFLWFGTLLCSLVH